MANGWISEKELLKEYRKLAKRADQRLVRLESARHDKGYKGILTYSYKGAMNSIRRWGGEKRFNTKPPKDIVDLESKIQDIKRFLESSTSTKSGVTKIYKKRVETLNNNWGTSFTWQEFATFVESGTNEQLDTKFGSSTKMEVVAQLQQTDQEIIDKVKESANNHLHIEPPFIRNTVENLIRSNGIKMEDLR